MGIVALNKTLTWLEFEPLTTYLYKQQINMTFDEYQSVARTTAIYPNKGSNLYYPALGLGEVGEIQNNIKKVYRDDEGILTDQRKYDIKKECGDVLWYLSALADECGFTLQEVAEENLAKLLSRQQRNQLQGSGDHR